MGRGHLTSQEIQILQDNPNVMYVSDNYVIYSTDFKMHFVNEYKKGKKPTQIFRESGFDPKILGSKRIERASQRWRESYAAGSLGKYSFRGQTTKALIAK